MSAEDKLNELIPNVISFEAGEKLTADKLNKLIRILNLNLEHIQGAVGDVYDVSGNVGRNYWGKQFNSNAPSTGAQKRRFDIANLARLIGPASNLNPQSLGSESIIKEEIPLDVLEYRLKYPKTGSINVGATYLNMGSKENLIEGRTYYIEDDVIYFSSKTVAEQVGDTSLEVIYTTNPTQYNGGAAYQGAGFNVYPDPNQVDGKLEVTHTTDATNGASTYTIDLPVISDQQGSFADRFETTNLDNRDINFNNQLKLPEWIQELDDGTVLPRYSLYLKNYDANESYIDATYTKISDTSVLVSGLEIGNQACIDGFDLRLITVGTDITTSIDDLRNKTFLHKHDGSFGEPRINIKHIVGFYEGQVEGGSGPYYPSSSEGNPISNYLHRDGYKANSDEVNGHNAMRGPLMMGLTDFNPITNRVIASDDAKDSNALLFGSEETYIQRVSEGEGSDNEFKIKNTLGNIKLNSPSNSLIGLSNRYILTAAADSRLTVSADATLNVNEGLQVKQLTDMPHGVERINKGYKIEEMPYYKLMLINPGVYETPPSSKGEDPKYIDIFDIWVNNQNLGETYYYQRNSDGVDGEARFQRFYELEPGSSTKGHFLNFVLRDGAGDNPDYVQYFWANKELNANLFFDLSRGNDFIISPLFELDASTDNYRPFEIHIFRGYSWNSTVGDQLNDLNKKFTAEYQIQLDMNFMSTLANNDWIGFFPSIILHYDYKHGPDSLSIENYEINADNGSVITTETNATTFFESKNIRRIEVPFDSSPDAIDGRKTTIEPNYSTGSRTSMRLEIGYDDVGIAKLSTFSINVKEEFWNGVFTVGIS
jgi:hypothetical protein